MCASTLSASSLGRFYLGEYEDARRLLEAALVELDRVPAQAEPFFEGITFGFAVLPEGRDGVLRAILEETIMLFHRFAREPAIAYTLCNVAMLERSEGRAPEARALLEDALERFRALGNDAGEALVLTALAVLRDAFRAADDAPGHGGVLVSWSLAEERAGEPERAAELARKGAEVWEPRLGGHLPGRAWLTAADLFAALGNDAAADRSVVRAEHVLTSADDIRGLALCAAHRAAKPAQRGG
jgi:tetratricopeptide (TPR) repeat protein